MIWTCLPEAAGLWTENFSGMEIFIFLVYQLLWVDSRDESQLLGTEKSFALLFFKPRPPELCHRSLRNVPITSTLLSPLAQRGFHSPMLLPDMDRPPSPVLDAEWGLERASVWLTRHFLYLWGSLCFYIKMFLYYVGGKCSMLACFQGDKEHSILFLWLPKKETP